MNFYMVGNVDKELYSIIEKSVRAQELYKQRNKEVPATKRIKINNPECESCT